MQLNLDLWVEYLLRFSHLVAGAVGGAIALAAGYLVADIGSGTPSQGMSPELVGRLTALERSMRERLGATSTGSGDNSGRMQALEAGLKQVDELSKQVAGLAQTQGQLTTETAALREQQAKLQTATPAEERIQKLEDQLTAMRAAAEADRLAALGVADPRRTGGERQLRRRPGGGAHPLASRRSDRLVAGAGSG